MDIRWIFDEYSMNMLVDDDDEVGVVNVDRAAINQVQLT